MPGRRYRIAGFLGRRPRANAEEFSVLGRARYDGALLGLGNLGRRLAEGAVGLFALLGFLYVPLGRHTGFEHARAMLSTPAASAAIEDVTASVLRLRQRAIEIFTGRVSPLAPPPEARPDHTVYRKPRGAALAPPRPMTAVPPKLE